MFATSVNNASFERSTGGRPNTIIAGLRELPFAITIYVRRFLGHSVFSCTAKRTRT
jgi:hypothetical protein